MCNMPTIREIEKLFEHRIKHVKFTNEIRDFIDDVSCFEFAHKFDGMIEQAKKRILENRLIKPKNKRPYPLGVYPRKFKTQKGVTITYAVILREGDRLKHYGSFPTVDEAEKVANEKREDYLGL